LVLKRKTKINPQTFESGVNASLRYLIFIDGQTVQNAPGTLRAAAPVAARGVWKTKV